MAFSAVEKGPTRLIVKLHSPSTFRAIHTQLQEAVRDNLMATDIFGQAQAVRPALLGTQARVLTGLTNLNMLVVEAPSAEAIEALKANPEVDYVEEEFYIQTPRPPSNSPWDARSPNNRNERRPRVGIAAGSEMTWGLDNMRVELAWNSVRNSGKYGAGVRVMVIDTGIDRDHVDIRPNFEQGRNFMSSRPGPLQKNRGPLVISPFTPFNPSNGPVNAFESETPPYDYYDQVGHGTHVAGTIAAAANNVGVVGVAPKARILAARVCGKLGCASSAIVAAIDWATSIRADVANLSLGGSVPSRAQEDALRRAENAGVTVVAASGNDGTASVSYPAAFDSVIAVGAINRKEEKADFSNWGPELDIVAAGVDVKSAVPTGSGRESKVTIPVNNRMVEIPSSSFVGAPEVLEPFEGELVFAGLGKPNEMTPAVRGKVALISRGEIPFSEKVKNALAAGAVGVVIYNNTDGLVSGALTQDGSSVSIPVVGIERGRGEELRRRVMARQAVRVTIQTRRTDFAPFQGTSMASPHVAGLAALVKAANRQLKPAQIREIAARTARPVQDSENKFGKGIADADAAVREAMQIR